MWGPESWEETGDRQYAPVTSATRKLRTRGQPGERVRTRRGEQTRKSQHHSGGPTRTKDSFRHTQGHIYGHGGPNSTSTASPRMKKAHSVTRTHTHCKERPRFFFSPLRGKRITSALPQKLASPMPGEGETVLLLLRLTKATEDTSHLHNRAGGGEEYGCRSKALLVPKPPFLRGSSIV